MAESVVDDEHFETALADALARYPRFQEFGARLYKAQLRTGHTFLVRYATPPPEDDPDAWEFQNAVVKGYKKLVPG